MFSGRNKDVLLSSAHSAHLLCSIRSSTSLLVSMGLRLPLTYDHLVHVNCCSVTIFVFSG